MNRHINFAKMVCAKLTENSEAYMSKERDATREITDKQPVCQRNQRNRNKPATNREPDRQRAKE